MKIVLIALTFISLNAFANDLSSTIRNIEIEKNAKCEKTKISFGINLGGETGTTFYTVKYKCFSNSGAFGLKVRMKDNVVRKVIFTK